jgi:hypothetical protein
VLLPKLAPLSESVTKYQAGYKFLDFKKIFFKKFSAIQMYRLKFFGGNLLKSKDLELADIL